MNLHTLLRTKSNRLSIQAFRFIIVGLIAFAVDYSVMIYATEAWHWNHLVSAGLGYMIGLVLNYALCVRWVFDHRRYEDSTTEFVLFAVIGVTGLVLTELILWTGTDMFGVDYRLSKGAAVFAVAVWNFVLRKVLLFSDSAFVGRRQSA